MNTTKELRAKMKVASYLLEPTATDVVNKLIDDCDALESMLNEAFPWIREGTSGPTPCGLYNDDAFNLLKRINALKKGTPNA